MIEVRIKKRYSPGAGSAGFSLHLDLRAAAGVTVLFGASGSGKTQTLDAIAGFMHPDQGRILLDDEILFDAATGVNLPPRDRHCGYVFQKDALFPHMTLRQNLAFAAERRPRLERHRKVNEMIERFRLTEAAGRRPGEVSGGERQRCSIARALIGKPKLLLLDDPVHGLNAPLASEFFELIQQIKTEFKIPVFLATNDLEATCETAGEMLVLHEGRVLQMGPPRTIIDRPASVDVARLLGIYNLLQAEIVDLNPQENVSRLRINDMELTGPYFPGRFRGDRIWVCVRPESLTVLERYGKPGHNQLPVQLQRLVELPHALRLEFFGGLKAVLSLDEYESVKNAKEWLVQIPPQALRVL